MRVIGIDVLLWPCLRQWIFFVYSNNLFSTYSKVTSPIATPNWPTFYKTLSAAIPRHSCSSMCPPWKCASARPWTPSASQPRSTSATLEQQQNRSGNKAMYVGEACIVWVITVVDLNYEHSLIEVGRKVIWFVYEQCL